MRLLAALALCLTLLSPSAGARGDAQPFLTARDLDLTELLAPPPAADSAQTKAELAEILGLQVTRTPAMEARAVADGLQDLSRFDDVLGPGLAREALPRLAALFDRLEATEEAVTDPAKAFWKRPRPYQASDLVRPVGRASTSGAYPSGHAALGTLVGIVLANMVPERRAAILARAREYGENRLVAGIHHRSDIEAGRIAGTVMAASLMRDPAFQDAFGAARRELRTTLGLPDASP